MKTARISEIFESIQGEGLYIGERQIFLRFFGCNLTCAFCDTPQSRFKEYSCLELKAEISQFSGVHSLCLTGGEPLCQADFLRDFLADIFDLKFKIYLETNGTLAEELLKILGFVDVIAMDFKLPSACGCGSFWKSHEEFLKRAITKEVFVKIVVTKDTERQDILTATDIIKKIRPELVVVLQPNWFDADSLLLNQLMTFKSEFLMSGIQHVRILPQAHKYAGIK